MYMEWLEQCLPLSCPEERICLPGSVAHLHHWYHSTSDFCASKCAAARNAAPCPLQHVSVGPDGVQCPPLFSTTASNWTKEPMDAIPSSWCIIVRTRYTSILPGLDRETLAAAQLDK